MKAVMQENGGPVERATVSPSDNRELGRPKEASQGPLPANSSQEIPQGADTRGRKEHKPSGASKSGIKQAEARSNLEAKLIAGRARTPDPSHDLQRSAYAKWDALLTRIKDERVPIHQEKGGEPEFVVPSLSSEDRATLHTSRYALRTRNRLSSFHSKQQLEIARVVRWVESEGHNAHSLILGLDGASLGSAVPQAIKTLFKNWGGHELVVSAMETERVRRRADVPQREAAVPSVAGYGNLEAGWVGAKHDEVEEFLRLLRRGASPKEVANAAQKVQGKPDALDELRDLAPTAASLVEELTAETPPTVIVARKGLER
jgi:hypothetical protein